MTDHDYLRWTATHAALFSLNSPNDPAMFVSWRPLLDRFEVGELMAASGKLAMEGIKWRPDHLPRLAAMIRETRGQAQKEEERINAVQLQGFVCEFCGNCGVAEVPHLRYVRFGAWVHPYYTVGVLCKCDRGTGMAARQREWLGSGPKFPRPCTMTLLSYEQANPRWTEMMASRREEQRLERAAHWAAQNAEATKEPTVHAEMRKVLAGLPEPPKAKHIAVQQLPQPCPQDGSADDRGRVSAAEDIEPLF